MSEFKNILASCSPHVDFDNDDINDDVDDYGDDDDVDDDTLSEAKLTSSV